MVEHERTGLLVPPHDADALADAIVRMLTDHPLADTLARAGHDLVHERFCLERMVEATQTLYDEGAATVVARSAGVAATRLRGAATRPDRRTSGTMTNQQGQLADDQSDSTRAHGHRDDPAPVRARAPSHEKRGRRQPERKRDGMPRLGRQAPPPDAFPIGPEVGRDDDRDRNDDHRRAKGDAQRPPLTTAGEPQESDPARHLGEGEQRTRRRAGTGTR